MRRVLIVLFMLMAPGLARASCPSMSASGLAFGTFTGTAITSSNATIQLTCSNNYPYYIGLNAGMSGGAVTTRQMSSGANRLNYAMYQDAGRTVNWGNTKGQDTLNGTTASTGSTTTLGINATLTATQYPAPGSYTDTIITTAQNSGSSTSFLVTAMVQSTCSISATDLNFGVYTGSVVAAYSTITATCTNTTPYNIGLSAGNGPGATVTSRQMSEPGGALQAYSLFRDSSHRQNWGVTIGTDTLAQTGSGSAQSISVYGQVLAGQSLSTPGTYTDTIVATLTY